MAGGPGSRERAAAPFGRAAVLVAAAVLGGCSSGIRSADPAASTSTIPVASTAPVPPVVGSTETAPPAPSSTRPGDEPAVAPSTTTPASQVAPDTTAGTIRFTRVLVLAGPDGRVAGQANATNTGADYRNDLIIRWTVVDRRGARIDEGTTRVQSLAPGETTTISLEGTRPFDPSWVAVHFSQS